MTSAVAAGNEPSSELKRLGARGGPPEKRPEDAPADENKEVLECLIERRVKERTIELERANEMLWREVRSLDETARELKRMNEMLWQEIVERGRLEAERERRLAELQTKLTQARTDSLAGLLHICVRCKRIRDDDGVWQAIEKYIEDRTAAEFSHGICPGCRDVLYPGL